MGKTNPRILKSKVKQSDEIARKHVDRGFHVLFSMAKFTKHWQT